MEMTLETCYSQVAVKGCEGFVGLPGAVHEDNFIASQPASHHTLHSLHGNPTHFGALAEITNFVNKGNGDFWQHWPPAVGGVSQPALARAKNRPRGGSRVT